MAAKSSLINMVAVLSLTCLLCSAILGGAYALTKEPIEKAAADKTSRSIALVVPEFDTLSEEKAATLDGKEYKYYEALKGDAPVGYAIVSSATAVTSMPSRLRQSPRGPIQRPSRRPLRFSKV